MNLLEYYSDIVEQYPKCITKIQFCEICNVSKSSAYRLLQSGRIAYEECTERLLHYYKIPLVEALQYKYEKESEGILSEDELNNTRLYYETILIRFDDALSVYDIHKITGYGKETIRKWIINGYLLSIKVRTKFKISKGDFIDFITSKRYCNIIRKSKEHRNSIASVKNLYIE